MRATFALLVPILLVVGCSASRSDDCSDVLCGACPQALELRVRLAVPGTGEVIATGVDGVACSAAGDGSFTCGKSSLAPGTYTITLSATAHEPETITFTLAPPPAGCCVCSGSFSRELTLTRSSVAPDGGPGADGGTVADAGDGGAMSCDPSAIDFIPAGGSLAVDQLCDDVFACVDGEAAAMAVTAASARFACSATPEGPCSGWTCAYRDPGGPSTLDAAEIAEICKITVLVPQPAMTCMIYL